MGHAPALPVSKHAHASKAPETTADGVAQQRSKGALNAHPGDGAYPRGAIADTPHRQVARLAFLRWQIGGSPIPASGSSRSG